MLREERNANMIALVSVLVWGCSLPVSKILLSHLGIFAVLGGLQAFCGICGLLRHKATRTKVDRQVFRNPYLYGRWIFFMGHLLLLSIALYMVDKSNIALLILLNYFWPTAIILFSVLFSSVQVTRHAYFSVGIVVVLTSLAIEILGPHASMTLFASRTDIAAYVIAFIGALCWGLYSALSRRGGDASGGGAVVPLFQITLGLALLPLSFLPLTFLPGIATWGNMTPLIALIFAGYALCQFCAYLCWDHGMRKGNIVFLSLCADFLPWLSLALAWVLLDAEIGMKTVLSGILLVAGAIMTRYGTLAKKNPPEPMPLD